MVALSPSHSSQVPSPSASLWPLADCSTSMFLSYEAAQTWTQRSSCSLRGKGSPLMQLCNVVSDAPKERLLDFLVERVCCGLIAHQSLQGLLYKAASQIATDRARIWIFSFSAPSDKALMLHTSQNLQHHFSQQPLLIDTRGKAEEQSS